MFNLMPRRFDVLLELYRIIFLVKYFQSYAGDTALRAHLFLAKSGVFLTADRTPTVLCRRVILAEQFSRAIPARVITPTARAARSTVMTRLFTLFTLLTPSTYSGIPDRMYSQRYALFGGMRTRDGIMIDSRRALMRLRDASDLLLNVFLTGLKPAVFGTHLFKNEIAALNWFYRTADADFWRLHLPFFTFRLIKYHPRVAPFLSKLNDAGSAPFIVVDTVYHFRLLHYLNRESYYTIGLIGGSIDPWLLSYPIPCPLLTPFTQFYFLKFLIHAQKEALAVRYDTAARRWRNLILSNQ